MKTNKPQLAEIHYIRPFFDDMMHISGSQVAEKLLRLVMCPKRLDHKEFFWILLLNNANKVLGASEISKGTIDCTIVNIKEIIQLAVLSNTSAVILAHNHPSGRLKPSSTDLAITNKIQQALKLIDVSLFDHLIITSEGYFSFADESILPT